MRAFVGLLTVVLSLLSFFPTAHADVIDPGNPYRRPHRIFLSRSPCGCNRSGESVPETAPSGFGTTGYTGIQTTRTGFYPDPGRGKGQNLFAEGDPARSLPVGVPCAS